MLMEPLKKLLRNNATTPAPAEVTIKKIAKIYSTILKGETVSD